MIKGILIGVAGTVAVVMAVVGYIVLTWESIH